LNYDGEVNYPSQKGNTKVNYTGGGALASTGVVTVAGIAFDQLWLIAVAVALVGIAMMATRFTFRPNLAVSEVPADAAEGEVNKK